MKFLRRNREKKTILVISDLHLGAGPLVKGKKNFLEDFHSDKELMDFLEYYSTNEYKHREVELVINGDFFDFLAVPFVNFFDDEFWSEKAALEKLKIILRSHVEVMKSLISFVASENKKVVYILGNHDAEMIFESARRFFLDIFPEEVRERFTFHLGDEEYIVEGGVAIKHGHQYESAHCYDPKKCIINSVSGESFFLPPWGSYYVTRIVNKFKEERVFINSIRPIRTFVIYGLIFDTFFTLRFIFANCYYFIMVIFLSYFKQKKKVRLKEKISHIVKELVLFQDFEMLTQEYFQMHPQIKVLIVGHTHCPSYRNFSDGSIFINTGTWTKMYNLDFARRQDGLKLTYAKIEVLSANNKSESNHELKKDRINASLQVWKGNGHLPYSDFN